MLSQAIKEVYHNVYLYKLQIIEAEVNTEQWINITIIKAITEHHTVVCLAEFVRLVGIGLSDFERGDLLNS